ncbi:farnesyl diphosphate synthase [Povalibacter sp.]|uniref:polyprenyl synthetase family protein n=1 Tax=Povalibacter sp. TaxID=1962978 RepID=UPI002F42EF8B
MTIPKDPGFTQRLEGWQVRIEAELAARLPAADTHPTRLHEALRYSVLNGGKRIRPALVYATAQALGLTESHVDGAACAIEFIHAYSLVHDDLPAMDNDDLRRGRPTCHKAFDEATAILVGDSLQVLAFQVLASGHGLPGDPAIRLKLVDVLAECSGTAGMAGGQAIDLAAQGQSLTAAAVEEMHARKTGALIRASVLMPAYCVPNLSSDIEQALDRYSRDIGLAFQIQDDLLDVEGDSKLLGKATGADQANHKPTYPSAIGVEPARQRMHELHATALEALDVLGPAAASLASLSDWLVLRRH